jgi:hypothetical protein
MSANYGVLNPVYEYLTRSVNAGYPANWTYHNKFGESISLDDLTQGLPEIDKEQAIDLILIDIRNVISTRGKMGLMWSALTSPVIIKEEGNPWLKAAGVAFVGAPFYISMIKKTLDILIGFTAQPNAYMYTKYNMRLMPDSFNYGEFIDAEFRNAE